jgi:hypothetical protein
MTKLENSSEKGVLKNTPIKAEILNHFRSFLLHMMFWAMLRKEKNTTGMEKTASKKEVAVVILLEACLEVWVVVNKPRHRKHRLSQS